ncbi:MAG: ribosomal protein S18-alanine N-acetyltransferase [Woeseiaceae bacterium]
MTIGDSLVLRAAHRSEAKEIAAMSRLQVEHGLNWRWTAAKVRRQIEDRETMVLVASTEGELQGFAIMKFGDLEAHLFLLAVDPKSRRNGIGTRLVHWLERSCETAGVENIRLEVRASNSQAQKFYEKLDYKRTGRIAAYYDGRETAVVMSRSLVDKLRSN